MGCREVFLDGDAADHICLSDQDWPSGPNSVMINFHGYPLWGGRKCRASYALMGAG